MFSKKSNFLFFLVSGENFYNSLSYLIYYDISWIPEKTSKELRMKLLSRPEELILLAVWRLKENAYCNPIKRQLSETTGKNWSFGAIYDPLDRLEKKGLLESFLGESTAERGGKSKRIYKLTPKGLNALVDIKKISEAMWNGISKSILKNST